MGGDLIAECMRPVTDGFYHFRCHFEFSRNAFFFGIQHTAGDHQLDQIDIFAFCLIYMGDCRIDTLCCDRYRTCHVPARYRDSLVCGKDSRAGLFTGFDFIAQPCIESAKTTDRADRGNAA